MANKNFTLNFDASMNISQIKSAISEMQRAFSGLKLSQGLNANIQNVFSKINSELEKFEDLTSKSFHSLSDVSKASSSFERIIDYYKQLEKYGKEITGMDKEKFFPDSVVSNITKANKALQTYYRELEAIPAEIEKANKALAKQEATLDSLTQKRNAFAAENKSLGSTKGGISRKITAKEAEQSNLTAQMSSLEASGTKKSSAEYKALASQYNILTQELKKLKSEATELDSTMAKNRATIASLDSQINSTTTNISQLKQELSQMTQSLNTASLDRLRNSLAEITGQDISQIPSDIKQIQTIINGLSGEELQRIKVAFDNIQKSAENAGGPINKVKGNLDSFGDTATTMVRTADEVQRLQNQVMDFFSISNAVQLFKRTIQSAFDTVKELDAAMTETAVVTDFSVGDMWDSLPQYTNTANELGASIQGVYETMTLFYQQGLNTTETFEIGTETLKMARIAGLDYAQTTDLMTAALRGFNMELNATSAQRINDVYSELAAITASDTEEIATAMTKTASIAASANMEFETTAAFLAQMIETTRESAENLGTAMKTIIARFTEIKKDPTGIVEVEGETASFNDIDDALRSVGVALTDANGKFRDLDDVFLDLSEKWNTLDIMQQRYVATVAAGSRQQSRFIAMMNNYERTMELVNAANNSAGASEEQFGKTMESLEAKLNKLKNAWDLFTMGIMDSSAIKAGVDLLTSILTTINNITDSLPGAASGFAKLGIAILGLKAGKAALNSFFGSIGKYFFKNGKDVADEFDKGFTSRIEKVIKKTNKIFSKDFWVGFKDIKSPEIDTSSLQTLGAAFTNMKEGADAGGAAYSAALQQVASSLGATTAQQVAFTTAMQAGVPIEQAAVALTNEEVAANILAANARMQETGATAAQTAAEIRNTAATSAETVAQNTSNASVATGLLTRIKYYAQLLFGNAVTRQAAASKLGLTAATTAEAVATTGASAAQWSLNSALLACPIGWIIAGIAALVALFVALSTAIYNNSIEAKLEAAAESTERAKAAAEAANTAYNDLLTAHSDYDELQNTLDGLTEGTYEWKQALAETNKEVLELISTYPELAQYMERGSSGQLTISEEGWQQAEKKSEEGTVSAANSVLVSQMRQETLKEESARQTMMSSVKYSQMTAAGQGSYLREYTLPEKYTQALYDLYSENPAVGLDEVNSKLEKLGSSATLTQEQLNNALQAFANYDSAVAQSDSATRGLTESLLTNSASEEVLSSDLSENLIGTFSNSLGADFNDEINQRRDEIYQKDGGTDTQITDRIKERNAQGSNIEITNDDLTNLQNLYADMVGIAVEEIPEDLKENKDALAEEIAKIEMGEEYAQNMEDFFNRINDSNEESVSDFLSIMSKDAEKLSEAEIESLSELDENGVKDKLGQWAKDLGYTLEDGSADLESFSKALGLDIDELTTQFQESIDSVQDQINDTKTGLVASMMKTGAYSNSQDIMNAVNKMTTEQRAYLESSLEKVAPMGEEAQVTLLQQMPDITQDAEAYKQAQSLINSIDFSNPIDSALALQDAMNSDNESIKQLATSLNQVGGQAFSTGEQFKYLLQSEGFKDVDEELDKFIEDTGKISPENIEEIAQNNADLNKLLSQGKVNATGLAKALTQVKLGNIDVDSLTTRVLEAISSVTTLDDSLRDMQNTIDNFDPGIDAGSGLDFLTESYDKMNEFAENMEYGNPQFQNYFSQIFGPEALEKALNSDDAIGVFNDYIGKLKNWTLGNGYGFWEQIGSGDIKVEGLAAQLTSAGDVLLGHINEETGQFEDTVNLTTEELIKNIAEGTGVSYDTANMMVQNYRAHSLDLAKQLGENDFKAAIENLLNPAEETVASNLGIISKQEVDTFATAMGKSYEEAVNYINEVSQGTIKIVDWIDPDTGVELIGDELHESIKTQLGVGSSSYRILQTLDIDTSEASLKIDELREKLSGLDLSDEQVNSEINSIVKETGKQLSTEVEIPVKVDSDTVEMQTVTVKADSAEGLDAAVQAQLEAANYNLVAEGIVNNDFSGLQTNIEGIMSTAATNSANDLTTKVNNIQFSSKEITITPVLTDNEVEIQITKNVTTKADASNAKGTGPSGFKKDGTSLVGEEGEELVQDENGAYLVGTDGPEIVPLNKGDIVYSNEDTKKILKGKSHPKIKRYALGKWPTKDKEEYWSGGSNSKKDSDSKSSGKSEAEEEAEIWENTFDWLYNLTQDINEELREREKLEKKYNRLIEDRNKSATDILENIRAQEASLEQQRKLQQQMYDKRKQEMQRTLSEYSDVSQYGTYNWSDNTVEINWNAIDKVTDTEKGERIEEYISKLEEIESQMDDAEDALDDIIDEIEELQKVGKDEYDDLESRVLDAIISREQEKIDKLSLIDESINDANTKLMNSIQSNLDKIRQDRQNQETEQSIEDNERRLAYLQQDTSGANALEIQQLQEELANQKQDYTDTLIDQKLSAIQEQNDKASEERQYQIELAQAQLEEAQKNGEFWNEAYRLIKEGTDATGKLVQNSELTTLLKGGEAWESMSNIQKMDWLSELENTTKAAMVYFSSQRQLEKIGKTSGKITFTNANGEKLTGTVQKDGSVKVSTSKGTYTYKEVFQNYDGTYETLETNPSFKANAPSKPSNSGKGSGSIKVGGLINAGKAQIYDYAGDKSGERQYFLNDPIYKVLDEKNGYLLTRWHKLNTGYTGWFKKSDVKAYAKGGLADFTGPAWLDGTKSKPELVLNARDTENFIQLKDILSNLLRGDTSSGNSGDNYFEIHIDVDSLSNDYDVEQLASKIKRMITNDAMYRNVNSINLLR